MNFKRFALAALSVLLLATGCYKEEIDALKEQVKDLEMNTLEEQVKNMNATVADLRALQEQVAPAVDSLMAAKSQLQSSIDKMEAQIAGTDSASVEMQATLIGLRSQMQAVDDAIKALQSANLGQRIDDLKGIVDAASKNFKESIDKLTGMAETFATLDELSKLQAAVDAMSAAFGDNFKNALEASKEKIISWVSESQVMKDLFDKYYTKDIVDQRLKAIEDKDIAQENDLKELRAMIQQQDTDLREVIAQAVKDAKARLAERIDEINRNAERIDGNYDALELRVRALEELPAVIGDYSDYKGTLIADILALQKIIGDPETDGTLVSLVNTLKLVLTQSEGTYFNLGQIVADILTNTGDIADHDSRIAALDSLCGTLATIEALNSLDAEVRNLAVDIVTNQGNITTLVQRVDAIVAQWTDQVYAQIDTNAAHIERLKEEDLKLWLAIEANKEDQKNTDTVLTHLIADINVNIAALMIPQLRDSLDAINNLLNNCRVGNIIGLQANLDSLDARIKAIWDVIGSETLDIKGSIINAINVINRRFGEGWDGTLSEILAALRNDLVLIKGNGWDVDSISIADLKEKTDSLFKDVKRKADASWVSDILEDVKAIQIDIADMITERNADEKLAAWLKRAEADSVYATIAALDYLTLTYYAIVGDELNPAPGTVLYQINTLNSIVGDGNIGGWTNNLTDAVNKLHTLVGDQTVEHQADSIAKGLIKDLIIGILDDKDGTVEKIAQKLKSFRADIDTLFSHVGDVSVFSGVYPDVATAIHQIDSVLNQLDNYYQGIYSPLGHTHSLSDITDYATVVDSLIKKITGKIEFSFGTFNTIVEAINYLYTTLDNEYYTGAEISDTLDKLKTILVAKFTQGDKALYEDFHFNLDSLNNALDSLIKGGGVLDSRIQQFIDALNISQYVSQDDLDDLDYIKTDQIDTHFVFMLKALNIDFKEWNHSYDSLELHLAIMEVYDSLSKYIGRYNAHIDDFDSLESVCAGVEAIIGKIPEGSTIKGITDTLSALLAGIGADNNVLSLIHGLRQVDTAIVRALLGKPDLKGDIFDTLKNYNLSDLKNKLYSLGLTDIHDGDTTLADILGGLKADLESIHNIIGDFDSYSSSTKDKSISDALRRLSEALGEFNETDYKDTIASIKNSIQDLIDTLSQKSGGAGSLTDIGSLVRRIDGINNMLENLKTKFGKNIEEILKDQDSKLDKISEILGVSVTSSTTIKDLYGEYQKLYFKVTSEDFLKDLITSTSKLFDTFGIQDLVEFIGDVSQFDQTLKDDNVKTVVDAINQLQKNINGLNNKYVSPAALDSLKNLIVTGNRATSAGTEFLTINQLAEWVDDITSSIGTRPESYNDTTAFYLIETIAKGLKQIGENTTNYFPEGTKIWEAIDNLYSSIQGGNTSLNYLINSLTYIPHNKQGNETVSCYNGNNYSNLSLEFTISTRGGISVLQDSLVNNKNWPVKAIIQSINITKANLISVEASAVSLDNSGLLKVSVSGSELYNALKDTKADYAQLSIAITQPITGESISSKYIQLLIDNNGPEFAVDPEECRFEFITGAEQAYRIDVANPTKATLSVSSGTKWFKVDTDYSTFVEIKNVLDDTDYHDDGKLTISATVNGNSYVKNYVVVQRPKPYDIRLGSLPADCPFYWAENSILTTNNGIPVECKDIPVIYEDKNFTGEFGVLLNEDASEWIESPSIVDNKLSFSTKINETGAMRSGQLTLYAIGRHDSLKVDLQQAELSYEIRLNPKSVSPASFVNNTLTTSVSGIECTFDIISKPECESFTVVPGEGDWTKLLAEAPSVSGKVLSIKYKDGLSTDESYSAIVKPATGKGQTQLTVKFTGFRYEIYLGNDFALDSLQAVEPDKWTRATQNDEGSAKLEALSGSRKTYSGLNVYSNPAGATSFKVNPNFNSDIFEGVEVNNGELNFTLKEFKRGPLTRTGVIEVSENSTMPLRISVTQHKIVHKFTVMDINDYYWKQSDATESGCTFSTTYLGAIADGFKVLGEGDLEVIENADGNVSCTTVGNSVVVSLNKFVPDNFQPVESIVKIRDKETYDEYSVKLIRARKDYQFTLANLKRDDNDDKLTCSDNKIEAWYASGMNYSLAGKLSCKAGDSVCPYGYSIDIENANGLSKYDGGIAYDNSGNITLKFTLAENTNTSDVTKSCGTIKVTVNDGSGTCINIPVTQLKKQISVISVKSGSSSSKVNTVVNGDPVNGYTFSRSNYGEIELTNNYNYTGGYKIDSKDGKFDQAPSVSNSTIKFRVSTKTSDSSKWKGGYVTVKTNDGICTLNIKLN